MRRAQSSYYENPSFKKNFNILSKTINKTKKLTPSISERYIYSKKYNNFFLNKNSNFNEDCKVKKIDIKFNILNNLKKFNTIYNNNSYKRLIKSNKENKKINTKFKIKILDNQNIPNLLIDKYNFKQNYFNCNLENDQENNNNEIQLDPHGYFPEDFSLNIYKSTSLYKNRYKIETCRLKKVLKNIYHEENSKRIKNLIHIIKKNTMENNISIKMFKLLKSKKIDRFVNRLLNINNIPSQKYKESRKDNSFKRRHFFLTNKNKKVNFNFKDKDIKINLNNICIQSYSNIHYEKNKMHNYILGRNFSIDINKNNTDNSGIQTINVFNNESKNKICYNNIKELEYNNLREQNQKKQNIFNNKYSNSNSLPYKDKNIKYKEIKFEKIKKPKKYIFLQKQKKRIRLFSANKINSSFLNLQK